MKVIINVYDVFNEFPNNVSEHNRKELRFSMTFPCDSRMEAHSLHNFAAQNFTLSKEHCSNWHSGIRAGYLALKSAYHFDGYRTDIDVIIED